MPLGTGGSSIASPSETAGEREFFDFLSFLLDKDGCEARARELKLLHEVAETAANGANLAINEAADAERVLVSKTTAFEEDSSARLSGFARREDALNSWERKLAQAKLSAYKRKVGLDEREESSRIAADCRETALETREKAAGDQSAHANETLQRAQRMMDEANELRANVRERLNALNTGLAGH